MDTYFPYDPDNPQAVSAERHEIDKGMIRLRHIPKAGSLVIDGFTETDNPLNIQSNQFFCYYAADRLYREANRLVYFNRGLHGQRVTCSYLAVGTPVTADDMNEIKDFMENGSAGTDSQLVAKVTQLGNDLLDLRTESRQILSEHNQNIAAHNDIRNEIAKLRINQDLIDKVDALSSAVAELEDTDENIFSIIGSLSTADDNLADSIYRLNQRVDAADDSFAKIHETVTSLSGAVSAVDAKIDETFALLGLSVAGLSSAVTELGYNIDDLAQDIDDETRLRKSANREINARIDALALSVADTAELDAKIAALSAAIGNNIGEKIASLSSNLEVESLARINADSDLGNKIYSLSATVQDILSRIDGETPTDPTVNEIIFNNKPHDGYNSFGKADFLTYVFGEQTPAAYSASGASAFIDYIF